MSDNQDNEIHESLMGQFAVISGATSSEARQYLEANQWELGGALTEYYTALEEGAGSPQNTDSEAAPPQPEEPYTGPRTLDGRPAPASIPTVSSSSKSKAPPKRGGIATLGSIGQASSSGHAGHGHANDDDDDEDSDYEPGEEPRDLFAGGEKSGLAVQDPARNDPRKVVNDILKKARANAKKSGGSPAEPAADTPTRFRGSGQTLGGDDAPSQIIPDPSAESPDAGPTQTRILHLWRDGFSVDDGPLRRFDDPQNANDLNMIRSGRAPLHLMGVSPNQPVDVQLIKHDDDFKAPPQVFKPFSGSGQRLGSPTPGSSSTTTTTSYPASAPAQSSTPASVPEPEINSSQPTVSLRIQLANGTRLPARFNTTSTIGEVYDFVARAYPESSAREWVLSTTFPTKDHTDKDLALGDVPEFKKGGIAVQKWKD